MPPRMHQLTLTFDDVGLERRYRSSRPLRWRPFALAILIAGLPTWPLFAWWAHVVLPTYGTWVLRLTLGWILPVHVLGLAVTRAVPAHLRARAIVFAGPAMSLLIGLLPVALPLGGGVPVPSALRAVFSFYLLTVYTSVNARFIVRVAMSWALVVAWMLVTLHVEPATWTALMDDAGWIVTAQTVGMYMSYSGERQKRRIFLQQRVIEEERAKSDALLRNMLPAPIAERLKHQPGAIADGFDAATVLFADIAGFTPMSERMSPGELVQVLNDVFSAFDEMARRRGLEKIKTIGDAYMLVGGLPEPRPDHAAAVAEMALEMRAAIGRFASGQLALRIGIHSGPVVAGVIGTSKYSYDLWGDTVNTASRMESHGAPGEIHVSEAFRAALNDRFLLEERGVVEIKGKGPMRTWWLRRMADVAPS